MSLGNGFLLANLIAVISWMVLLVGVMRGQRWTNAARWCGALLILAYIVIFALHAREAAVLIRDYSLNGISSFFSYPGLALAGWIHYLAFDLWVGAWEVDEAPLAMPRGLLVLLLLLTFAVGPLGLGVYLLARKKWRTADRA